MEEDAIFCLAGFERNGSREDFIIVVGAFGSGDGFFFYPSFACLAGCFPAHELSRVVFVLGCGLEHVAHVKSQETGGHHNHKQRQHDPIANVRIEQDILGRHC